MALTQIINSNHVLWTQWLDLYAESFPDYERMPIATIEQDTLMGNHPTAAFALCDGTNLLGLAYVCICEEINTAYLIYLAINPQLRGQGFGRQLYADVCSYSQSQGCHIVLFEVEHPDDPLSDRSMAERRIRWYLRNGAMVLTNLDYRLQPENTDISLLMYICVHKLTPIDADSITARACALFKTAIQVGKPCLSSNWPFDGTN